MRAFRVVFEHLAGPRIDAHFERLARPALDVERVAQARSAALAFQLLVGDRARPGGNGRRPRLRQRDFRQVQQVRLASIIHSGGLHCDTHIQGNARPGSTIGMPDLKRVRLHRAVDVHPGATVGDYVPFYFCSRSVMLYVLFMRNHAGLTYTGGQGPILHMEADLHRVLDWAEQNDVPWAVSLGNASALYAEFRNRRGELDQLKWHLIHQRDFRDPEVKEAKQSELLIHRFFPWELFDRIGTHSDAIAIQVAQIIQSGAHRPTVQRMPGWYYG